MSRQNQSEQYRGQRRPVPQPVAPQPVQRWYKTRVHVWRWTMGCRAYFSDPRIFVGFVKLAGTYLGVTTFENADDYFLPVVGQIDGVVSLAATAGFVLKVRHDIAKLRPPKPPKQQR